MQKMSSHKLHLAHPRASQSLLIVRPCSRRDPGILAPCRAAGTPTAAASPRKLRRMGGVGGVGGRGLEPSWTRRDRGRCRLKVKVGSAAQLWAGPLA
jgi:hypothetical protein